MASASSAAEFRARATHLVVFQHGLWGNEKDFRAFEALFTQYFPHDEVYPYIATSNATSLSSVFQTYDGIDTGGTRLADEIETVAKQMPRLSKFSILGHSLGGLYARYCCGVLFARGFFEDVEPMNFVTLATPHLGIRRSQPTIMNAIHNSITPNLFDLTGQQFALKDRATTQTIALSHSVRRYPHRRPQVVYSEIEDMLLVQLPHAQVHPATTTRAEAKTFEVVECMLREGALLMYRKTERIPVVPEETSLRDEGEHASSTPETDNEASGEDEEEHGGMSDSESASQEAGATQVERIAEIDLLHAHVTVVVPEKDVSRRRRRRRHRTLGRRASAMPQNEDGSFWDIEITVDAPVDSSDGTEEDARATGTKATYTIRLPYDELPSKWKWVVALSNASHGLYCRSQSSLETTKDALASVSAPSVLSCLTRGQFIQALQLFRNRSVYASIFNDMQVPYSCGAIRAFNPYRTELDSSEATRSPYYHHIVMRSIYNAPLLRDTLPEDVKDRAERDSPPSSDVGTRFSLVKMLSERTTSRRRHSSAASHQQSFSTFFSNLTGSHSGQTRASLATSTVPPPVSSSASSRVQESGNRSASSHSFPVATTTATTSAEVDTDSDSNHSLENALADGKRMAPFEDGSLLLDHADLAFSNDELRDTLRGMMLSLQSVGWRRIDVHFHSPLAHMKIIAMTANPSKPMTKGLDVVHHVMDTFLL